MADKLFLVKGELSRTEYALFSSGDTLKRFEEMRLVKAETAEQAENKFTAHFTEVDPYGLSVKVEYVEAFEPIE